MWCSAVVTSVIATVLLLGCGDDNGAGSNGSDSIVIGDLAGTWNVEVWEYALASDSSQKVDWVDLMGLSGTLTISQNGDFTVTPRLPGGFGHDDGTLTLHADSLYWDGEDDEEWVRFELTATLSVFWPETEFVDMNQDGTPEDAYLKVVFRRT
jgi:hypothetical protein